MTYSDAWLHKEHLPELIIHNDTQIGLNSCRFVSSSYPYMPIIRVTHVHTYAYCSKRVVTGGVLEAEFAAGGR